MEDFRLPVSPACPVYRRQAQAGIANSREKGGESGEVWLSEF